MSGEKTSISLGSWADTALVMARTGTLDQGAHGVSAFYVDLRAPGVSRARFRDLGTRAIGRGQLFFDEVRVPAAARIGAEGAGFVQVMQGFDFSRSLIGLMCVGAAQQSLDETIKYVTERQAFGSALARFEGVSFPLAEAAVKLRAARLLCYEALWLRDRASRTDGWRRDANGGRRNSRSRSSINACCCTAISASASTCPISSGCATLSGWKSATALRRS